MIASRLVLPGGADGESGYVLKRIRSGGGHHDGQRLSFLREAYFGNLINTLPVHLNASGKQDDSTRSTGMDGRDHIVRYVESFEVPPTPLSLASRLDIINKGWASKNVLRVMPHCIQKGGEQKNSSLTNL